MTNVFGSILIGGGTGFVGTHLSKLLQRYGYGVKVISRMPGPDRITWDDLSRHGLPDDTTAVVNLAGQNVLDQKERWTAGFKDNVWNSRVNTTQALSQAILTTNQRPSVFVVMTGVGIYKPSSGREWYTEESETVQYDFFSNLCHQWEKSVQVRADSITRKTIIRSGVVLGRNGGMIKEMFLPFYECLGEYDGLGKPDAPSKQYLPWIHIDDICRLIVYAIEKPNVQGVLNGVAPQTITTQDFSAAFARALHRPDLIPVSQKVLHFLLSEERAKMLTHGQKVVIPLRTQSLGFTYQYPDIHSACMEIAHL